MFGSTLSSSLLSLQQAISFSQIVDRQFDPEQELIDFHQNKQQPQCCSQPLGQNLSLQMSQFKRPIIGLNSLTKSKQCTFGHLPDALNLGENAHATLLSPNNLYNKALNYDASTNNFSSSSIIIESPSTNYFKIYSRKVFIGGLPPDIDESKFKNLLLFILWVIFFLFNISSFKFI
jgi:hypothetical protein